MWMCTALVMAAAAQAPAWTLEARGDKKARFVEVRPLDNAHLLIADTAGARLVAAATGEVLTAFSANETPLGGSADGYVRVTTSDDEAALHTDGGPSIAIPGRFHHARILDDSHVVVLYLTDPNGTSWTAHAGVADLASGALSPTFELGEVKLASAASAALLDARTVRAGSELVLLDLEGGALAGRIPLCPDRLLADGPVVACAGTLARVGDAGAAWSVQLEGRITDIAVTGDTVVVRREDRPEALEAFELATGEARWRDEQQKRAKGRLDRPGSIAVADGVAYAVTGDRLHALQVADGSEVFRVDIDLVIASEVHSVRVTAPDTVVLLGHDAVIAFDRATGAMKWTHDGFTSPTAVVAQSEKAAAAVLAGAATFADTLDATFVAHYETDTMAWGHWEPAPGAEVAALTAQALSMRSGSTYLTRPSRTPDRYAAFLDPQDRSLLKSTPGTDTRVVVVDLQTGARSEIRTQEALFACIANFTFVESQAVAIQTFVPNGGGCKQRGELYAFAVPLP